MRLVVLLGIVSLFADITYEGARSITGPYLALLGASGAVVGIVSGLGELVGYSVRLLSGYLTDRTQRYWGITFLGYGINLLAVPLLALAGSWEVAACLIILERFGKAIRVPARDAMLSYATKQIGRGWGFGIHEAFDQVGGILGPLVITAVLLGKESYQFGFAILLIPALLALGALEVAKRAYPQPQELEVKRTQISSEGLTKNFWIYLVAVGLVAAGHADFALIAYHFQKAASVPPLWIPLFYAFAMGTDGIAALFAGKQFDLKGVRVLAVVTAITSIAVPLVFLGGFYMALAGMLLWGVGMGAQGSIIRAMVGNMISAEKRGSAYGILNLVYGLFWAGGSAIMGLFYDISILYLILFSLSAQLLAIPLFLAIKSK